jgi:predicted metal-dependent phosphoesterase TrpH
MIHTCKHTNSELGGARINLLIALSIMATITYSMVQYVPVAYEASTFKEFMQHQANTAAAAGRSPEWLKNYLKEHGKYYGVPLEAEITTQQVPNGLKARIRFTRYIELPGYIYHYQFDHTVTSGSFIFKV